VTSISDLTGAIESAAGRFKTPPTVHPDDHLFSYLIKKHRTAGVERYFKSGHAEAAQISRTISQLHPKNELRILDFAAGYGRVIRHLPKFINGGAVVASDIHPQACEFIQTTFGIETHQSSLVPEELDVGEPYDFIYAHSFFSHVPDGLFGRWMAVLYRNLRLGGYLLVTTNGEAARRKHPQTFTPHFDPEKGYGFKPSVVDQPDIPTESYGSMNISHRYFVDHSDKLPGAMLISFRSQAWFGQQDEWIVQKPQ
jgi:SAM-dependent methyltransferase